MSEVIGVFGHIGSGKSHFSKLISEHYLYEYLDCDKIFKEQIIPNELFRKSVTKLFKQIDVEPYVNDKWNVNELKQVLFINESITEEFNDIVRTFLNPILQEYIRNNDRVLIEMATLPMNPIKYLCDKLFFVGYASDSPRDVVQVVQKRNPELTEEYIVRVLNYQIGLYTDNTMDDYEKCYSMGNTKFIESRNYSDNWNTYEHL